MPDETLTAAAIRRRTRRAFLAAGASGVAASLGWYGLTHADPDDGIPWPLRRTHRANEQVGRTLFAAIRRVPEYAASLAETPRANGPHGMPTVPPTRLLIEVPGKPPQTLDTATALAGLPRAEATTELKCVEGWSAFVTWGGVRFRDFAARIGVAEGDFPYVAMTTADGEYFVGLDAPSVWQGQTLLCDRMNGAPLNLMHGAPLRLIIPVKYGIKNIKWLGVIRFHATRPEDYWALQGYDWYAGL